MGAQRPHEMSVLKGRIQPAESIRPPGWGAGPQAAGLCVKPGGQSGISYGEDGHGRDHGDRAELHKGPGPEGAW